MDYMNETIEFTERKVFLLFGDVDKSNNSQFTIRKLEHYEKKIQDQLPSSCHLSSNDKTVVATLLRKFRRQKTNKKTTLNQIIDNADDSKIVLSIYSSMMDKPDELMEVASVQFTSVLPVDFSVPIEVDNVQSDVDVLPSSNERDIDVGPLMLDEKPANKVARGSGKLTVSFTNSYKDFVTMSERQRHNVSAPLIDVLEKFIASNNYSISTNQLLGYLLTRENPAGSQLNKLGKSIYEEEEVKSPTFTALEGVSFMHSLVLSKEQTRRARHFLSTKGTYFPTTDAMLPVRKSLRAETFSVLDGKGRGACYRTLVSKTVSSIIKVLKEEKVVSEEESPNMKVYLKDGGDGAGQMPSLKSKVAVDDSENIFQYGIIPLKMTKVNDDDVSEDVVWVNPVPNSARSLRPVYLIREKETNKELLHEVVHKTDEARNHLNTNGVIVDGHYVKVDIKDTMKDLKFKKVICGLGGAACLLCKSQVKDWTNEEKIWEGFKIDRSAADTKQIFDSVVNEHGDIVVKPRDFDVRSGVTQEAISDSDQHSITITHSYINGCTWFLKLLYRCYTDYRKWEEKSSAFGDPVREAKEEVRDAIKEATGLKLDYVNSAGGHTGTSTTGEQARRFFSDTSRPIIKELLSSRINMKYQEDMLKLHEQLSIVLRIISCTRKINVPLFEQHCEETCLNIAINFPWALINHTLHGALQHSAELIEMNGGESIGWYSEEGLEANNKDIRQYLGRLSRKTCNNKQIEDVHNRLLERSDPYLIYVTSNLMSKRICSICLKTDHTVRSHYKYAEEDLNSFISTFFIE